MIVDDSVVVRGLVARWLHEARPVRGGRRRPQRAGRDRRRSTARSPISSCSISTCPSSTASAALPQLLRQAPELSVIVVSTLTQRNADDLAEMPVPRRGRLPAEAGNRTARSRPRPGSAASCRQAARARGPRRAGPHRRPSRRRRPPPRRRGRAVPVAPRCLLIGASTGGPRAIAEVLAGLGGALRRCRCSSCSTCRRSSRRSSPSTCSASSACGARAAGRRGACRRARSTSRRADAIWGLPAAKRPADRAPRRRRTAGQFLPSGRRRSVPRRRRGLRRRGARGRADRHGLRRHARARSRSSRAGADRHRAGRGDEHRLGHARQRRRGGPRRRRSCRSSAIGAAIRQLLAGAPA